MFHNPYFQSPRIGAVEKTNKWNSYFEKELETKCNCHITLNLASRTRFAKPNKVSASTTSSPFYKLLKPYLMCMQYFGLYFVDDKEPVDEDELQTKARSAEKPTNWMRIYSRLGLLVQFSTTGFYALPFLIEFNFESYTVAMLCASLWTMQNGFTSAITHNMCTRVTKFQQFFKNWDELLLCPAEQIAINEYIIHLRKVALIMCNTFNAIFSIIWIAIMSDSIARTLPEGFEEMIPSGTVHLMRFLFCATHIFSAAAWSLPTGLFVILCMGTRRLLATYNQILSKSVNHIVHQDLPPEVIDPFKAETFRMKHQKILRLVETTNSMFGLFILTMLLINLLILCFASYMFLFVCTDPLIKSLEAFWTVISTFWILYLVTIGAMVHSAAHEPHNDLSAIPLDNMSVDNIVKLTIFLNRVGGPEIGVSAWGFSVLSKSFLSALASMLLSYFFLLVQFQSPTGWKACPASNRVRIRRAMEQVHHKPSRKAKDMAIARAAKTGQLSEAWNEVWTPDIVAQAAAGRKSGGREPTKMVHLPPLSKLLGTFLFAMKVCGLFHMTEQTLTFDGRCTVYDFIFWFFEKVMSLAVLLFCWSVVLFNVYHFPIKTFGFDSYSFTCIVYLTFFTQNAISATTYYVASVHKKLFKKLFCKWQALQVPEEVAHNITVYCNKAQWIVMSVGCLATAILIAVFTEMFFIRLDLQDVFVEDDSDTTTNKVQIYGIQAIISVFICVFSLGFFVLVCMVLRRLFYACHKELCREVAANPGNIQMETFRVRHESNNTILEIADNIYSVMIFAYFFNYMLMLCIISYELLWIDSVKDMKIIRGIWCMLAVGTILVICVAASSINQVAHKSFKYLHRTDLSVLMHEEPIRLIIYMLRLTGPPLGLTAWSIFTLTREVILTMASVYMTYLLVLGQIQPSRKPVQHPVPTSLASSYE